MRPRALAARLLEKTVGFLYQLAQGLHQRLHLFNHLRASIAAAALFEIHQLRCKFGVAKHRDKAFERVQGAGYPWHISLAQQALDFANVFGEADHQRH